MKWHRISALMYVDFLLVRNSKWRLTEYLYFPLTTVVIYGLFALFMRDLAAEAGLIVLIVNVLWSFAQLAQSHVNMSMNEDSWSGSLRQILVSGVTDFEYLTARVLSSILISLAVLALLVAVSVTIFGLAPFFLQGPFVAVLIGATLIASIGLSIFVAGAMIWLGREYNFLAWTAVQLFILLSAPFYPTSLFPGFLQPVVQVMPYTHVFEAARGLVSGAAVEGTITTALLVAIVYFVLSLPFYKMIFKEGRRRGWLVRFS